MIYFKKLCSLETMPKDFCNAYDEEPQMSSSEQREVLPKKIIKLTWGNGEKERMDKQRYRFRSLFDRHVFV